MAPSEEELTGYYQTTFARTRPHLWYERGIPSQGAVGSPAGLWVLSDLFARYLQPVHFVNEPNRGSPEALARAADRFLAVTGPVIAPQILHDYAANGQPGHHMVVISGVVTEGTPSFVVENPAPLDAPIEPFGGPRQSLSIALFRSNFARFPLLQWVGPMRVQPLGSGFPPV